MSGQTSLNVRNVDPSVVRAFKLGAMAAGMSHGEWLHHLVALTGRVVEREEGGQS